VMVEDVGITLEMMMENAGPHLAPLTMELIDVPIDSSRGVVLGGSGGNGGIAMVAVRRLHSLGVEVRGYCTRSISNFEGTIRNQARILSSLGLLPGTTAGLKTNVEPTVVLDAVLGYGLEGEPAGRAKRAIE